MQNKETDAESEGRLTFGQFESRLGRNKHTEVVVGAGVGGDKSWRWRFRKAWLERGLERLKNLTDESLP